MVQLAASGYEVDVSNELIDRLGLGTRTPEIRGCWTATTTDYSPVLIVELPTGVLITSVPVVAEESLMSTVALRWEQIASIRQDERGWMLAISTVEGHVLPFLLASVAELHALAAELARGCGTPAEASPASNGATTLGPTGEAASPSGACTGSPRAASRVRSRAHSRVEHEPSPTLDRIEQRLATMEILLAGLASGSRSGDA